MHVRDQALAVGDCGEKFAQRAALFGAEPGGEPALVLAGEVGDPAHQSFARRGEVLVWPGFAPLLPVARLTALGWLVVAGALLPTPRPPANR